MFHQPIQTAAERLGSGCLWVKAVGDQDDAIGSRLGRDRQFFDLTPATGAHKALYYFSADLSDDGLKSNSALLRFCNSLGPTNSLLKTSSYLLHQNGFNIARNYLLRVSASILQDDSGIPLRNFIHEKWTLRFFSTYTGPLNLFKSFFQADLRQYYATSSPKPLTFGFGYQYNRQDATLILVVRR